MICHHARVERVGFWIGASAAVALALVFASALLARYVLDTWDVIDTLGWWGVLLVVGWPVVFAVYVLLSD